MHLSQIEQLAVGKLRPHPSNVHTHSKKQLAQIAKSIKYSGFIDSIIRNENGQILAGHGRWIAAKQLGLRRIPVITVCGLSDAQQRAFMLAANKLVENAGWDRDGLANELNQLAPLLLEAGLDIDLTGFEAAEIDGLLADLVDPEADPADEIPSLKPHAVSARGDVWQLGPHRLSCGDARNTRDVQKLMGRERAAMVCTDVPYNMPTSSVQGRGRIKHGNFAHGSGEMSQHQFTTFLTNTLTLAAEHSVDGSIHYVFMDWRHMGEILAAGERVYGPLKNLVVWVKTHGGMGTFYRSQHELIFVFKKGNAAHQNNFELGQHGRSRTNVWNYPGVNTFRVGRLDDLSAHPTVKPVAMIADAMRDCSRRNDIVLDPFLGSGTTILAAERVGRRGYGLEIDPIYVDVAIRRWRAFTKRDAILQATDKTFDEVAAARSITRVRRAK